MKQSQLFTRTIIATAVALTTHQTLAAGFQINAQSATGFGRAFAGDAVIADNTSALARNPASMALFDRTELSLGLSAVTTDIKVDNVNYAGVLPVDGANNGATSLLPNFFIIHPINNKFAVGTGIYTNYGTTHEFASDFGKGSAIAPPNPGADAFGGITNITTLNWAITGSYRLNEQWSFGAGIDVIYGEGELKRSTNFGTGDMPLLDVEVTGFGFGFNLGAVYELDENNRFGLSYHYSPDVEASGDVEKVNSTTGLYETNIGDIIIPLPSRAEFSGYHRLKDTAFAVHYSVQWIDWSVFDKLETTNGTLIKDYKWQDGIHYSIGATYYVNPQWEARIGYMYDTSAQDKLTSISVPDSDRQWLSAGASYHIDQNHSVDFGLSYVVGEDVKVDELNTLTAKTNASGIYYGLQYSYRF